MILPANHREQLSGSKTNRIKNGLISVFSEAQKAELGQNWVKNVKRIMLRIVLSGFEKYYSLGLWTGAIFIRRFNNI